MAFLFGIPSPFLPVLRVTRLSTMALVLICSLGHPSAWAEGMVPDDTLDLVESTDGAPMDEDWHNGLSTRALLSELTRLANALEDQKRLNAALAKKMEALVQRVDGMQTALEQAGTLPKLPPLPIGDGAQRKPVTAVVPDASKPAKSAEPSEAEGYLSQLLSKGKSAVEAVTERF